MSIEKAIASIDVSKELFESVINFLDIKLPQASQENLTYLFNNLFQAFNSFSNSKNLQHKDIEKLSFNFIKLQPSSDIDLSLVEKLSSIEKSEISKTPQKDENTSNKKDLFETADKKLSDKESFKDTKAKTAGEGAQRSFQVSKFSNDQIQLVLSFVKLASQNLSTRNLIKNPIDPIDKKHLDSLNLNRAKEPIDTTIKLNLKLFNEAFSQSLKGQFEVFQTRLIEQPPFGIVAFYIKEKDRKTPACKTRRRKKKKIPKKHVKYKKEHFEYFE